MAMKEPVLDGAGRGADYRALRLLYLPTWDHPIAVRYEQSGQGVVRRVVRLSGSGGYGVGEISLDETNKVTAAALDRVLQPFDQAGVWSLPDTETIDGNDGAQLVVETVMNGRHRVLVRWSPDYHSEARGLTALDAVVRATFEQAGVPLPVP
jgi:hypothetical protein